MLEYVPKFPKIEIKKKVKKSAKRIYTHDIEKPEKLHCRKCGAYSDTCCYRHLETYLKHEFGKGTGIKCNDKLSAYLCYKCDLILSTKPDKNNELEVLKHSEQWLKLIIKTWIE